MVLECVCSCGMSVVLGGVWLEGCVWLMGVDGYGVWVVVECVVGGVWVVTGV